MVARAERDFEEHLRTLGMDAFALTVDASGTLALSPPARLSEPPAPSDAAELDVGRELGRGGMGVVHAAVQRDLGREVAVKRLRAGASDAHDYAALISEARVTGSLEHPNIVPIHRLTVDEEGRPALVMKKIDGSLWSDYLADPETIARDHPHVSDALELHLEVLMSVCNALDFAHTRGVIHRDIKPSNVMIGRFGEVYLLDWGLAVGLDPAGPEHLPLAREVREPAGSPGYMAPEMAAGEGALIDERTDVYLLGAVLCEVLTGHPPHQGATLLETLQNAFRAAPPVFSDDVPPELAAISRRALAFDPADRFESARDVREALAGFLRHRAARALSDEGDIQAAAYDRARERGDTDATWRLATEARFAYQLALRAAPNQAAAKRGLSEMLERLVADEIARGNAAAARQLITELDEPPAGLLGDLEALELLQDRERRRVLALEHELEESNIAQEEETRRARLLQIGGVAFTAVGGLAALRLTGVLEATPLIASLVMAVITAVTFVSGRTGLNDANRRARSAFLALMATATAYLAIATLIGQDLTMAIAIVMLIFGGGSAAGAGLVHRSAILTTITCFVIAAVLLVWPSTRPIVLPVGVLAIFASLVHASRRAADASREPRAELR